MEDHCWICRTISDILRHPNLELRRVEEYCKSHGLHVIESTENREDFDLDEFGVLLLQFVAQDFQLHTQNHLLEQLQSRFDRVTVDTCKRNLKQLQLSRKSENDNWISYGFNWIRQTLAPRQISEEICGDIYRIIRKDFLIGLNIVHLPGQDSNGDMTNIHSGGDQKNVHILHDFNGIPWISFVDRKYLYESFEDYIETLVTDLQFGSDIEGAYFGWMESIPMEQVKHEVQTSIQRIDTSQKISDLAGEYILHCMERNHSGTLELLVKNVKSSQIDPTKRREILDILKGHFIDSLQKGVCRNGIEKITNEDSKVKGNELLIRDIEKKITLLLRQIEDNRNEIPILSNKLGPLNKSVVNCRKRVQEARLKMDAKEAVIQQAKVKLEEAKNIYKYKINCSQVIPSIDQFFNQQSVLQDLERCKSNQEIISKVKNKFGISPPAAVFSDQSYQNLYSELITIFQRVFSGRVKEKCKVFNGIIQVTGKDIYVDQELMKILVERKCRNYVKEVRIIAARVIYLVTSFKNDDWHGINLVFVGRTISLKGDISISTAGKKGTTGHAYDDDYYCGFGRRNGAHGPNGGDGEHGGHIYIETEQQIIKGNSPWQLCLDSSGGDGGHGQNGGDGGKGADGIIGQDATCPKPKFGELKDYRESRGSPGENGGNGGNAGSGGQGGKSGDIKIVSGDTNFVSQFTNKMIGTYFHRSIKSYDGVNGDNGHPGEGAPGGKGGMDGEGHYWAYQIGWIYNGYTEKRGHYSFKALKNSKGDITGYDLVMSFPNKYSNGAHGRNGQMACARFPRTDMQLPIKNDKINVIWDKTQQQYMKPIISTNDHHVSKRSQIVVEHEKEQELNKMKRDVFIHELDKGEEMVQDTTSQIEKSKDSIVKYEKLIDSLRQEIEKLQMEIVDSKEERILLFQLVTEIARIFEERVGIESSSQSPCAILMESSDSEEHEEEDMAPNTEIKPSYSKIVRINEVEDEIMVSTSRESEPANCSSSHFSEGEVTFVGSGAAGNSVEEKAPGGTVQQKKKRRKRKKRC